MTTVQNSPAKCLSLHPKLWGMLFCSLVMGCTAKPRPQVTPELVPPAPPPLLQPRVDSEAVLAWAQAEPVFLIVEKGCHTVKLYRYGRLDRSYPAVFGRNPGRKTYEGDRRTPTGLYMIIGKSHHSRWARFLWLDYPTEPDLRRYWQQVSAGLVPKNGHGHVGAGGAIGIHGTDREAFNRTDINWTLGCISLFNHDIKELYSLISVGTLVYIRE
jgi:murein L,D-transpeptidase YafK